MKILELKLKKDVLIVDESDFDYYELSENGIYFKLEKGDRYYLGWKFEFICKGSKLTEEIASELVELTIMHLTYGDNKHKYRSYVNYNLGFDNALESFISAVESKKFHWLENPIEKPINYDLWAKYGDFTQYGKKLTKECLKWQEAEEKTFKNPLIFVKND